MSNPVDAPLGSADAGPHTAARADELEHLRRLILPAERDRLDAIERRLDDSDVRADELSRVLPESVTRAARRDNRLGLSLSTVIDAALTISVRKNRQHLAEVLSPAMGPAIRRAIAEALRAMVDSFNQVLQHSFSVQALRWRGEAWRTGRSFAEVVLNHCLVFRVEHVFLVYRENGLLLQHVAAQATSLLDGDLVSGMLTAIQDFVRDSFAVEAEQAVDTLRVGDLAVWIEQGEYAYLAAVIRGTPPSGLRSVLRDALDTIHLEFGDAFERFAGDAGPFELARRHLEGCLQLQVRSEPRPRRWLVPAIVAVSAVALLVTGAALEFRTARRWNLYLARLAAEPGIVVVKEEHGIRHAAITGLRDPDAADPLQLLSACGLDANRVTSRWEPYLSQAPTIGLARAKSWLEPPVTVALTSAGGVLTATGSAPHRWVLEATRKAAGMPGVRRFDASGVTDEGTTAVDGVRRRLEPIVLGFDPGSAELPPRSQPTFSSAVAALHELSRVASASGVAVRVAVIGHTDSTRIGALQCPALAGSGRMGPVGDRGRGNPWHHPRARRRWPKRAGARRTGRRGSCIQPQCHIPRRRRPVTPIGPTRSGSRGWR